jgi:hypothetical protein
MRWTVMGIQADSSLKETSQIDIVGERIYGPTH